MKRQEQLSCQHRGMRMEGGGHPQMLFKRLVLAQLRQPLRWSTAGNLQDTPAPYKTLAVLELLSEYTRRNERHSSILLPA